MAPPPMKSGSQRLSDVARKVVVPSGITSTGWPAVRDVCTNRLGIEFDPWQDGAGRIILAKRDDGMLAVMIGGVGMSLPRQVGKTYLIGAIIFALCILRPGLLVIWSAHHARTHGETFLSMQSFADRVKVRPYIRQVFTGSGDEEIRFVNGSRILFGARERGFGRGIPGVDVIVSDEAQIMSDKALDAQLATMNTSLFGLAIFVGTPPRPDDPSEAFTRMRAEAWDGSMRDAAWIEFGADPDAKPDDRKQWAKANPSFPHRTPAQSILRLRRKLTLESFRREGLGIWDEDDGNVEQVISKQKWDELVAEPGSAIVGDVAFGVDVSPNRRFAAIAAAGLTEEGRIQVEVVATFVGLAQLGAVLTQLVLQWDPVAVVIDRASAAAVLESQLAAEGIEANMTGPAEMGQACGGLFDDAEADLLRHLDDPALNDALRCATTRSINSGAAWAWDRRGKAQITPLVAVSLARYGIVTFRPPLKAAPAQPLQVTASAGSSGSTHDIATAGF